MPEDTLDAIAWAAPAQRAERLLQLRRVAEAVHDGRLRMRTFVDDAADCGTARCVFGWAAVDPWFLAHTPIALILPPDAPDLICNGEDGVRTDGFRAMARLFGLSYVDARALFGAGLCASGDSRAVTTGKVLANIDRLLVGRDAETYDAVADDSDDEDEDDDGA